MSKLLGIVNMSGDSIDIEGLSNYRSTSAISLLGRYRLIDFVLSNMSNSDIDQIHVYVKDKPRSIIEHIGSGRMYNLNSKRSKVRILMGENNRMSAQFNHDINAFAEHMSYIDEVSANYVVIAPAHFICRINFEDVLQQHLETKADITVVYKNTDNAKEEFIGCDWLTLNGKKEVIAMEVNRGNTKQRSISLETYVMSKEMFKKLVKAAQDTSSLFCLKDIIAEQVGDLLVRGYSQRGYVACINNLSAYYKANMDLKKWDNISSMFSSEWPIYTRTNDSPPAKYGEKAIVSDAFIANGCLIEGTVINSVIGRGTIVKENAVVKDCVILAEGYIESGTHVENAVIDKKVKIKKKACIKGAEHVPLYIKKYDVV